MAKDIGSQCKQCRREGEKLFLKGDRCFTSKCAIVKRNYAPGPHYVNRRAPQLTEYGTQLRAKQKVKRLYVLREAQFHNIFERASKAKGNTSEDFVSLLERRLDNVVFRAGFAPSRRQARQAVNHAHFLVNGRPVNIPSFTVKVGDVITIKPQKATRTLWEEVKKKSPETRQQETPSWLAVEWDKLTIRVVALPDAKSLAENLGTNLVVEFYSK